VENPQIVMIVTLEGTNGGEAGFGAPVAAPVFREVAMAALRMLDVPKDLPDTPVTASNTEANGSIDGPRSVSSFTPPSAWVGALASSGSSISPQMESPGRRPFLTVADGRVMVQTRVGGQVAK
jgi:hypothetical protein